MKALVMEVIKEEINKGLTIGNRIKMSGLIEDIIDSIQDENLPLTKENIKESLYGMDDIADTDDYDY